MADEEPPALDRTEGIDVPVLTLGPELHRAHRWTLSSEPEWTVGAPGSGTAELLSSVTAGRLLPDGSVVLLDGIEGRLHIVTGPGAVASFGARGEGPGEFLQPVTLSVEAPHRVWVFDRGNGRISAFHPSNGLEEEVSLRESTAALPPLHAWAFSSGRFLAMELQVAARDEGGAFPRALESTATVTVRDRDGSTVGTGVTMPGPTTALVATGGDVQLPFTPRPVADVRDGTAAFGAGSDMRTLLTDDRLASQLELHGGGDGEPIPAAELSAVREAAAPGLANLPPPVADMLEEAMFHPSLLPPRRPELSEVKLDMEGRLWLGRFRPSALGPVNSWLIIETEGIVVGWVDLPPGFRLLDAARDRVLVAREDAVGRIRAEIRMLAREGGDREVAW